MLCNVSRWHSPRNGFHMTDFELESLVGCSGSTWVDGKCSPVYSRKVGVRSRILPCHCYFRSTPRLGGRPIGRTPDSGSGYPGSSPGLPANLFNYLGASSHFRDANSRLFENLGSVLRRKLVHFFQKSRLLLRRWLWWWRRAACYRYTHFTKEFFLSRG
jgi:hypothetical protein